MADTATPSPSMTATVPVAPPSAPMLTTRSAPADLAPDLLDDIPEPTVPAAVIETVTPPPLPEKFAEHEALLQGFCQHLQRRLQEWIKEEHAALQSLRGTMDVKHQDLCKAIETVVAATAQHNEHASYQLSDALLKLQGQGIALRHDPYTVNVQALSPQGYPLSLHIAKAEVGELITALPALCAWLHENGYAPQQSTVYP